MKIEQKKQIVEELRGRLERAKIVIATDYKGLDVESINSLRKKLRETQSEYQVAKNSLLIRASEGNDTAVVQDVFKGPTAIALNYEDPVAPAKVLTEFAKDHKHLEIKAGVMGGKLLSVDDIKALSALPSREVLLAQVLSTMNGVPTGFVRTLNAMVGGVVNVLQAIKNQKEEAEA